MDRSSVERVLQEYVDALESASLRTLSRDRYEYQPHYGTARNLLARWQGGESEECLRAAVVGVLADYRTNPPPGSHAEVVGAAFGAVCRTVGVM